MEAHTVEGRGILQDLKSLGQVSEGSTPDDIRDLFFQGFELIMITLSEVKFFETKLDQLAPVMPPTQISSIRSIAV